MTGLNKISLIIPTHNRCGILTLVLRELERQSLSRDLFEVIVVDDKSTDNTALLLERIVTPYKLTVKTLDTNSGPATARNAGAELASGKYLAFIGDDTIPNRHLLFRFLVHHTKLDDNSVIQGYTDWHPQIPPDDFHQWLHGSLPPTRGGLQANWNSLKSGNGTWISEETVMPAGWFLTTCISLPRALFYSAGGFSPMFKEAVWEDIEFGARLRSLSVAKTFFNPNCITLHYHKQTLDGFINRQIKEGRWRLTLASLRPETASQLIDPAGIRSTSADMLRVAVSKARELHYCQDAELQEIRQTRWHTACQLASLEGIRQEINRRGGVWLALPHVHTQDQVLHLVQAGASLERGDPHYAIFSMEWCLKDSPDNWAVMAAYAEVLLVAGDTETAKQYALRASELGAGEKWPMELLEKLR